MADHFPHTSRAGHHGLELGVDLLRYVGAVAGALIPGDEHYPSGADAQVASWIQDRASQNDVTVLTRLSELWPVGNGDDAASALASMEAVDPVSFAYLRELVYHAYYSSRRVLAAMSDRGYRYHGAPQPLGYRIAEAMQLPTKQRGSYIPTEEVHRVSQ